MSIDFATDVDELVYPDSDGEPMADNTIQWQWIVKIVEELEKMFAGQDVFVAGDLFWYPVQGSPEIVVAPDALVAFGRKPGDRRSYRQWEEGNIAPQVVFEVLSLSNTARQMAFKLQFYEKYGVEEYYVLDPYFHELIGYTRQGSRLIPVSQIHGFSSPLLGIRFEVSEEEVSIFTPDGHKFESRSESELTLQEKLDEQRELATEALAAKEKLIAQLRALGIDPVEG